jgi:ferredoxin
MVKITSTSHALAVSCAYRERVQRRLRRQAEPLLSPRHDQLLAILVAARLPASTSTSSPTPASTTPSSRSRRSPTTSGGWAASCAAMHRYATDGMILTMLLHMHAALRLRPLSRLPLRFPGSPASCCCVLDLHRRRQWFHARLGQAGAVRGHRHRRVVRRAADVQRHLIRNFLYEGSVNSRLFTLLAFLHIGVPLIIGIVMWVHVQRVPRAHINPPRPIAIRRVADVPRAGAGQAGILSQGGEADISVVPTGIAFDWFELPRAGAGLRHRPYAPLVLPVSASASMLFVLVPWLPPKKLGAAKAVSLDHLPARSQPCGQAARFGETLLDAGLRQEVNLPYECRNGGCGVCKCTVLCRQGRPRPVPAERAIRRRTGAGQGALLLRHRTRRRDRSSTRPRRQQYQHPGIHRPRRQDGEAHLRRDARPAQAAENPERSAFKAGQYVNIILDDGQRRAFSFANPPHETRVRSNCRSA